MCCFSLIFNEIQIWGNKKRFECKHNRNLKKISNSDKIHICTWRGQDLLQFRLKDSKPSQAIQQKWSKASCLRLSPLSSLSLRTFQVSSLYLNSLAVNVNTSIMAALRSILQVISKNKAKKNE